MTKLYLKNSFWNLVIQTGQTILGTSQLIVFANEDSVQRANYIMAAIQALLGIISIWTADKNKNNIIDIAEDEAITVTATGAKNVTVTTDNGAHSFTEGAEVPTGTKP